FFLFYCFFPVFKSYKNAYQENLWTYNDFRKHQLEIKDIVIKNNKKVDKIEPWLRVRLGLIFKPITIDINFPNLIFQCRIEIIYFILNFLTSLIMVMVLFLFFKFYSEFRIN
ncbi:hypothetical protein, partial [Ornithobacterium rhinotracheale]|uniref:hypothetical protein n=1 Tax=Ornithobacterium rhinotracheale TaxID=28251 RepID=UPI00387321C0